MSYVGIQPHFSIFSEKSDSAVRLNFSVVPGAGIEPARPYGHKILSLERLPIPPSRQDVLV